MKTKTFTKKLSLNKNTVAHLGDSELNEVYAGISGSYCGYDTCYLFCFETNRFNCPSAPWTNCTAC